MSSYLPASRNTLLGRLDVRAKLAMLLAVILLVFTWKSLLPLVLLALGLSIMLLLSGVPPGYLLRAAGVIAPFALFLIVMQGLFAREGETVILGPVPEYVPLLGGHLGLKKEGLLFGVAMAARMYSLLFALPVVVMTTDVSSFVLGLVRMGLPFRFAFIFSSALRFIPLLFEEAQAIIAAQKLRGLDIDKLPLHGRINIYARIAVPLILGALGRSLQMEIALQSRAFTGSDERTYLHEIRMRPVDYQVIVLSALIVLLAVALSYI